MKDEEKEKRELELNEIEEKLLEEEEERRQKEMLVSGKSVFEIKRIKEEKPKMDREQNEPRK